jgi:membrane-bound lytic murein transglycosylase D
MSTPFCQLRVRVQHALSVLVGLTVASGCALTSPPPEPRSPSTNEAPIEAPIDLITSIPTPTHETPPPVVEPPVVSAPEPVRDVLDPVNVRAEFTHLFELQTGADVPPALYQAILQFVDIYTGRARDHFANWLAREGRWGPLIREELRGAGLPEDLVYLSLVESGFSNTAVSRARAVGMWQFMEGTARSVGLRVDGWVDERRDPQLATAAAIRHLHWLHGQTQDWALAAAAYNAGLGRVTRIQKHAGESDYFRLVAAGRLPDETRNYVPAILAAALIAHNRERFGFAGVEPEPPFVFETIDVEPLTRLSAVSRAAGTTERVIRELNPQLMKGAAPPGGGYRVRIPHGVDVAETSARLAALPAGERLLPRDRWATIRYTVRAGDGWGTIAQRHHTTVAQLRKQNPRVRKLHPGTKLKIRVLQHASRDDSLVGAQPAAPSVVRSTRAISAAAAAPRASHTVKSGETMSGIAKRYAIPLASLVRWNGMARARPLRVGERLRLTPPDRIRHKVAAGESLAGLAKRYKVTLRDLMKWNRISRPRGLKVGEVLIVAPPH